MKNLSRLFILLLLFSMLSCQKIETPVRSYTQAQPFVTAKDSDDRIAPKEVMQFTELSQPYEMAPTIMIDPKKTFQTIEGFGGALTDASAETFYKLPADKQQEFMKASFDPVEGNGYNLCRTNIHSCDFSSGSYIYAEEGDVNLENFSIEHDMQFRVPFIKEAMKTSGDKMLLFASPWSPPAWMKDTKDILHGGKLLPEYFQTWANYYVKFVGEYEKQGIPIWGLSVQNEPMATQTWESCIYTGAEESAFVRDYMGPTLQKNNLARVKLIIWDHNRGLMYQRAQAVYDDPEAAKYVWGTGFHWYVTENFDNVRQVHDAFPDKKLIFTEGTAANFSWENVADWKMGEKFGKEILMDLNNWTNGWTFWNVLLDEQGGPNHVGNFCTAPIIGNTQTGELIYMNSHYYIGHFSRFIKAGAKRISCTTNSDDLMATAFMNPDESIAVVVLNLSDKNLDFDLWQEGKVIRTPTPAHSIVTVVVK